jgi:hypothetical protein
MFSFKLGKSKNETCAMLFAANGTEGIKRQSVSNYMKATK